MIDIKILDKEKEICIVRYKNYSRIMSTWFAKEKCVQDFIIKEANKNI